MPAMEPASLLRFLRKLKEVFDVCDEDADGFIRVEHFVALGLQFGQGDEVSAATPGPRVTFTCCAWPDPARAAPSPTLSSPRSPSLQGAPGSCLRVARSRSFRGGSGSLRSSGGPGALPLPAWSPLPSGPSAAFPRSPFLPKDSPAPSFPGGSRSIPRADLVPLPGGTGCLSRGVFILGFVRPG